MNNNLNNMSKGNRDEKSFFSRYWAGLLLLLVAVVFIIIFALVAYYHVYQEDVNAKDLDEKDEQALKENHERCLELGCSYGDIYVGSVNSDKYYDCDCHYAERIMRHCL